MTLPKHYACSLDLNPRQRSVFLCGVAKDSKDPSANPAIISYSINEKGNWVFRGALERTGVKLVSCVKALVQDPQNYFVTGESSKSTTDREQIRVYDAASGPFEKLQPVLSYDEHDDIITSLAHYPGMEGLFFSGSRDCTVKLWDKRQPKSVGISPSCSQANPRNLWHLPTFILASGGTWGNGHLFRRSEFRVGFRRTRQEGGCVGFASVGQRGLFTTITSHCSWRLRRVESGSGTWSFQLCSVHAERSLLCRLCEWLSFSRRSLQWSPANETLSRSQVERAAKFVVCGRWWHACWSFRGGTISKMLGNPFDCLGSCLEWFHYFG